MPFAEGRDRLIFSLDPERLCESDLRIIHVNWLQRSTTVRLAVSLGPPPLGADKLERCPKRVRGFANDADTALGQ